MLFVFHSIPNNTKLKKCVYVPDQYKTQQMCDKGVNNCLASLKFVPHWFVTCKMIKKLFTAL